MPLLKAKGNMYSWCSHVHNYLRGQCPHKCSYCYVQTGRQVVKDKYTGPIELDAAELKVNHNTKDFKANPKTIFICHMTDLFAEEVPDNFIALILRHCNTYPGHTYVFQTKNPGRMARHRYSWPPEMIRGTTIESNRAHKQMGSAPLPIYRAEALGRLTGRKFVTIEPVMDFDLAGMQAILHMARPNFICIGADSKGNNLDEPSPQKIKHLLMLVEEMGIEIRAKNNLERILGSEEK